MYNGNVKWNSTTPKARLLLQKIVSLSSRFFLKPEKYYFKLGWILEIRYNIQSLKLDKKLHLTTNPTFVKGYIITILFVRGKFLIMMEVV